MFLHIVNIDYLEAYKLRLTFSNHTVREVDLAQELYGEIFEPLKDVNFFRQVFLNPETNTIEWPNGADFAPEFLYDLGQNIPQTA
ncbi:DUF2442 domain-containing protein [Nodosilinea sp. LEGE 07298]|uniref:DUF2442 domain-containing protein n=1 Tax=Nodosilinea sp. LEGE 07298 TaxID=2777970 RepID=UPI00188291BA|nr:DUF2442 domain-containing protein [Nodosilinea sp. LEGE 07298]MBE9111488.1 DUF2442 domain-containing protein [Nodosilinea sp. LEGE 07298]